MTTRPSDQLILVLNAGSSSLKYQLLHPDSGELRAKGLVERIGEGEVPDHRHALTMVFDTLADDGIDLASGHVQAVGHRVVHGGRTFHRPTVITDEVVREVKRLSSLAPLHNPANIVGIEVARELLPELPQVAVFDTAFFFDLPEAAATYAIDRKLAQQYEIRRYGFHGTSHEYVSQQAARTVGRDVTDINQIVLHLGNGASASAVRAGRAVETSMGMTPLEGLVMGTRGGDIDPGIIFYLTRFAGLDVDAVDALLNRSAGLKGLCGENDFRSLGQLRADGDAGAQLAYDVYIHRLRKYVGAYLVTLGVVDVITFTAGVGENDPQVRADSLGGLENFGIRLDPQRNSAGGDHARVISTDDSPITVLVVPTNEELAIARASAAAVALK